MSTGKAERAGVTAVVDYLDKVDKFEPFISYSDKAPIIDGYFNIYKNGRQKVEDFFAQIPVQVKGTASDKDYYFRIGREHVDAYVKLGGIVFFKVIVDQDCKKILYAILSKNKIDELQKQSTKDIKINLNEAPTDPKKFETEIFEFATKRNGEKVEDSSPKEIADLVKGFENIRKYIGEIKDNEVQYELESLLDSIKNTKDDGTIGWRDKFIYYSRKALDLAAANIKGDIFVGLQHDFGLYLYKQKQYHLVKGYFSKVIKECVERKDIEKAAKALNNLGNLYCAINRYDEAQQVYLMALKIYRKLAENNRKAYIGYVAQILNNLANLHCNPIQFKEAEQEYQEALKIRRELAEKDSDAYIAEVGQTLNNLARLHRDLIRYEEAEQEFQESLNIRRKLAETNRSSYIEYVANTLNNIGALHQILSRYEEAEQEYQEAMEIYRELAETNRKAYIGDVAQTLNNLANLHCNLTQYKDAEQEYREALEIYRELAVTNRDTYIGDAAMTLNNLAILLKNLNRYEEAEQVYLEASNIYRVLSDAYPDVYIGDLARTLENLALLLVNDEQRLDEARDAANEALSIYKELSDKYPQILNSYVEKTQRLLDLFDQHP